MNYLCPQCQHPLKEEDNRWYCDNNHSFDKAKQGYCNLLLVQNKRSKIPGDNADMVQARRRFLSQNFYQPISEAINHLIKNPVFNDRLSKPKGQNLNIIDAGCGEGYYTNALSRSLHSNQQAANITGVDISKFAVKAAANLNKDIAWFVGNSSHLPVADNSCDYLLSLFSPIPKIEFVRVLNNEGYLLLASTGSQHLIELREKLYDEVKVDALNPAAELSSHFNLVTQKNIELLLPLNRQQDIQDLLAMTPHYWRASPDKKQQLQNINELSLTVDVNLFLLKVIPQC
ncbi:MAG: 23S rRNA (guanine745-N1)-methyltransferase [Pseudohongiellaceae bacterium]|jgi:23S rRNA (guanine745-N1)-methyltransferase